MAELKTERFLRDVGEHVMEVKRDDGLYRHLRFRKPGTMCMHFDLITWPGYLCYTGDMGTYVFSRLADMFEFFRPQSSESRKGDTFRWIDRRYWAEKLEGTDRDGSREYDPDAFKREITKQRRRLFVEYGRDMDADTRRDFWASFAEVFEAGDDGESYTYPAVRDWSFTFHRPYHGSVLRSMQRIDLSLDTDDFPDCKRYTHRFNWCCMALRWGIAKYDESKVADGVPGTFNEQEKNHGR